MNWFELKGDERLGECATEKCGGQPTSRFEAGGIASNYCSGCREKIEADGIGRCTFPDCGCYSARVCEGGEPSWGAMQLLDR